MIRDKMTATIQPRLHSMKLISVWFIRQLTTVSSKLEAYVEASFTESWLKSHSIQILCANLVSSLTLSLRDTVRKSASTASFNAVLSPFLFRR